MGLNTKGGISILILTVMLTALLTLSLMLYQLNRMTQANAMYYNMNEARNLALALETKYLQTYSENMGRSFGEISNKQYIVEVINRGSGFEIFIVVEYQKAIYTINLEINSDGVVIKRLDNVPRGN